MEAAKVYDAILRSWFGAAHFYVRLLDCGGCSWLAVGVFARLFEIIS